MSTDLIEMWHSRARPNPTEEDFNVQLGCHFEEIVEFMDSFHMDNEDDDRFLGGLRLAMEKMATLLKNNHVKAVIHDRKEFLDAAADQVVTAVGVAYCAGMKPTEAIYRVNRSNWSKYDHEGKPIFNEAGKIAKGPNYTPPNLEGLY